MIGKKFSKIKLNILGPKSNSIKANSLKSIFLKNKGKAPSILINSKNSEVFDLKKSKDNNSNLINSNLNERQKSLPYSKTNLNFFRNKISFPNLNQKKQSFNSFKNMGHKYFPLKIISNNPSLNNFKNVYDLSNKNEEVLTNSTNYNNLIYESNIYQKSKTITVKKDEFEISEEDKMFDQFLLNKRKIKKDKIKKNIKFKKKKKKLNVFNSYDSPLRKVYKKIPQILNKIEITKRLKNSFSLLKYQNLLFDIGSKTLDWNLKNKLDNEFMNIRNINDKSYELLRKSIIDIEKKEKKIIDNINRQKDTFKKNMRENNYYCMTIGMNFHSLPSLKFQRTVTKLKYKQKGIL